MTPRFAAALAAFIAVMASHSPAMPQSDMMGGQRRAVFELSARQVFGDDDRPRLVVSTAIPYSRLVFFLKRGRYVASYRVFLELRPDRGGGVRGEVWEETIEVGSYEETQSRTSISRSIRSFDAEKGAYLVRVTVEVIDTSLKFTEEKRIRIIERRPGELSLSDPSFMFPTGKAMGMRPPAGELAVSVCDRIKEEEFVSIAGSAYNGVDVWARISHTLVGPSPGDEVRIAMRIRDLRGKILLYRRDTFEYPQKGHLQFCTDLALDGMHLGYFTIETSVSPSEGEGIVETSGEFLVLFTRSSFLADFDDTVEILSTIGEGDELDELRSAVPPERYAAWERFWKRKDPTPKTEENERFDEFVSRLAYVMKRFSRFEPGWRTDRGKIYLEFGEPDKVADYPGQLGRRLQYWYYYSIGTIFVFEDPVGSGEYQLLSTEVM